MKSLFDTDGFLMRVLSKIADTVWLNILFLICSIPIFTIGASITALYYVTFKTIKDEEGYITKDFFRSFKENFRQSTVIWLVLLVLYAILGLELTILLNMNNSMADVGVVIAMIPGLLILFVGLYVFPLLSRFENTTKVTVRNALLLSIANIPKTLLALILTIAIPVVCLSDMKLFPLVPICAFAVVAQLNSSLFYGIFEKLMPKNTEEQGIDNNEEEMQEEI